MPNFDRRRAGNSRRLLEVQDFDNIGVVEVAQDSDLAQDALGVLQHVKHLRTGVLAGETDVRKGVRRKRGD